MKLKQYWLVTKPGIIAGNLISVAGGFFLAARGSFDAGLFLLTLIGVSCVIASGCICNNLIDRDIDALMERTRHRGLVQGVISPRIAVMMAIVFGLAGGILLWLANPLAMWLGLVGFIVYVGFYTLWLKRRSVYGTVVGSLSGAMPPVIGYCAVSHQFDAAAFILLLIFSLWQMPHSYAIAIFRLRDYQQAGIPVLPVISGVEVTRYHIVRYIAAFAIAALLLTLSGYAGYGYLAVSVLVGVTWLVMALRDADGCDSRLWARQLFVFSIVAITVLSVMMSVDFVAADELGLTVLR